MSRPVIRPRDLVRLGEFPHAYTAEVLETSREGLRRGRLKVRGLVGQGEREVLVRDVTAHWRRVA